MTHAVDVSVVLAVRNGGPAILPSLRSILAQTFDAFEFVIVDDGSTDDTARVIESLRDSRIRTLVNRVNLGLAASLNRAIDAASGRYVARMDADDIAYPERLATQFDYLERHREVDLLGTRALMFKDHGAYVGLLRTVLGNDAIQRRGRAGSFPLYHPTWMGKTEWFRRHRYDPSFRKSQDFELLLRAAPRSTYANIPDILLGYRYDPAASLNKRLESRRSTWRAMKKNFPAASNPAALIRGGLIVGAKASRDVLLSLPLRRAGADITTVTRPTADQIARWEAVWSQMTNDHD